MEIQVIQVRDKINMLSIHWGSVIYYTWRSQQKGLDPVPQQGFALLPSSAQSCHKDLAGHLNSPLQSSSYSFGWQTVPAPLPLLSGGREHGTRYPPSKPFLEVRIAFGSVRPAARDCICVDAPLVTQHRRVAQR